MAYVHVSSDNELSEPRNALLTGAKQPEAAENAKPDTEGAPVAAAPAAAEAPKKAAAKRARPAPKAAATAAAPAAAAGTSADEDTADTPVPPQAAKKPRVSNAKKAATAAAPAVAAAITAAPPAEAAAAPAVAAPAAAADDVIMGEQAAADKENVNVAAVEVKEEGAAAGGNRRAAASGAKTYKETGTGGVRTTKKDRVAVVEEGVCASEAEALEATNEVKGIRRRCGSVSDTMGVAQTLVTCPSVKVVYNMYEQGGGVAAMVVCLFRERHLVCEPALWGGVHHTTMMVATLSAQASVE